MSRSGWIPASLLDPGQRLAARLLLRGFTRRSPVVCSPPNKALQLTGRRLPACQGSQPPAARVRVDSPGGRRSWHPGSRAAGS
ncbi:MAG TPA: hypothetical protein VFB89_05445 [Gemmatimonadales bacterium]|nr:hypothetical protein [Gemmatimonadales bacterium]